MFGFTNIHDFSIKTFIIAVKYYMFVVNSVFVATSLAREVATMSSSV